MNILLFSLLCLTCSIAVTANVTQNWQPSDRSRFFLETQGDSNMKTTTNFTSSTSSSNQQSRGNSYNYQQTTIGLNSSNLKFPYILKVSAVKARLIGTIKLNGKIIRNIDSNSEEINLSPYLSKGNNVVEIVGNYSPSSSSIKVEFSGYGAAIDQQTSGSGTLKHRMNISVY